MNIVRDGRAWQRKLVPAITATALFSGTARAGAQQTFPRALDDYVSQSVSRLELPGAALAVVKDGRVVVTKGYGVRELGKPDLIDANTIFDIASLTKSFTAAAVGALVDDGTLVWDDPVRRHLPQLTFADPYLTANVTLRDLLSHRTGIAAANQAAFSAVLPRAALIRAAARMPVVAPFRERYVYSNVGYTIAAEAAATAAGSSWRSLVTQRLLVPLGMTRTTADFAAAPQLGNLAVGHALFGGVQRAVPRGGVSRITTEPAGAVQSSAADLARWMNFHLSNGSRDGKRILSADALNDMHSPHIVSRTTSAFRESRQVKYYAGYGMGWQVFDYRGHRILWHSGNGDGQVAYMAIFPDAGLGVAVLVNSWKADGSLNRAIASRIFDHYLNLPTRDYVAEWQEGRIADADRRADEERAMATARQAAVRPTLPLAGYAGRFRDELALTWTVSLENDTLRIRHADGEQGTLTHWSANTFRVRWTNPLRADDAELAVFVRFPISGEGVADLLLMEPGPFRERVTARREANAT
ncbi:MAG: serine hydrolase [Gemmatimonadota bacterium]